MIRVTGSLNPRLRDLDSLFTLDQAAVNDVLQGVDQDFRTHERQLFDSEGVSSGEPWKPLSEAYKKRKDRLFAQANALIRGQARARGRKLSGSALRSARGSDNKILQLGGDMKRAFATKSALHVAEAYRGSRGWVLRLGAAGPPYAAYHATGGGRLPQRNPIAHSEEQWRAYLATVQRSMIPHVLRRFRVLQRWKATA